MASTPYDYISQILRSPKLVEAVTVRLDAGVLKKSRGECWEWQGRKRGRYGAVLVRGKWEEGAHRVAYALAAGSTPYPFSVCHHCDNPACCNPHHLFLGTATQNAADMMKKGRHRVTPQPGEKNPRARLTDTDVTDVRRRIAAGETNKTIAAHYGVSHSAISLIRRGKAWGGDPVGEPYDSLRQSPYAPSPPLNG